MSALLACSLAGCQSSPHLSQGLAAQSAFQQDPTLARIANQVLASPLLADALNEFAFDAKHDAACLVYVTANVTGGYEPQTGHFDTFPNEILDQKVPCTFACISIHDHRAVVVSNCALVPVDPEQRRFALEPAYRGWYALHVRIPENGSDRQLQQLLAIIQRAGPAWNAGGRSYDGSEVTFLWYSDKFHHSRVEACVNSKAAILVGTERGTNFDEKLQGASDLYDLIWRWMRF
jgi:hypothetical protein